MTSKDDPGRPTARPPRRGRPLRGEESDLWRRVTDGVVPLSGRDKAPLPTPPAGLDDTPPPPAAGDPEKTAPPPEVPPPPPSPRLPELGHGSMAGVDRRTALRLKRGQMAIEARIDLHGLTQIEAHRALSAFLEACQGAGRRCVLVITGKSGVLRGAVPGWLNQPPNRSRMIAFSHAAPRDGGEGALYVLVRRKK